MRKYTFIYFILTILFLISFTACNSPKDTIPSTDENITIGKYTTGFVGKLVDSFVSGVDYTCDDITNKTDYLGHFNCKTTPVEFSIGNISLGSIENMTTDYLIFPQDLVGQRRSAALHPDVTKLAILFQSLDSDANPENGITIDLEIIKLFNQVVTEKTTIQDITLTQLNSILKATIDLDTQNNLKLVSDTQAKNHLLSTLSQMPELP